MDVFACRAKSVSPGKDLPSLNQVMAGGGTPVASQVRVKLSPSLSITTLGELVMIFGGARGGNKTVR